MIPTVRSSAVVLPALLLAGTLAQAEITLSPRAWHLPDSVSLAYTLHGCGLPSGDCRWQAVGQDGDIVPMASNVFFPPPVSRPTLYTVCAYPKGFENPPGGTAKVMVWPQWLHKLMDAHCPEVFKTWFLADGLPFMGMPDASWPNHAVRPGYAIEDGPGIAPLGVPVHLGWRLGERGEWGTHLTYLSQGDPVRMDVTGHATFRLVLEDLVTLLQLETLTPGKDGSDTFLSHLRHKEFTARGAAPLPLGFEPGGLGGVAVRDPRIRNRGCTVPVADQAHSPIRYLVADTAQHAVYGLGADGVPVRTWGTPGTFGPGREGEGPWRLHGPTAVVWSPVPGPRGSDGLPTAVGYVADTENHTILEVNSAGGIRVLAGATGTPGDASGPGPEARFNRPVSLALDDAGRSLFVADQGNQKVKIYHLDPVDELLTGRVTDLLGAGRVTTFSEVRAVAHLRRFTRKAGQRLLVVADGHCLRQFDLADLTETPLAGVADQPARCDLLTGADLQPCLDHPSGLAFPERHPYGARQSAGQLYVVDRKGLRSLDLETGALRTLMAASGTEPGCRPGLLSDQVSGPLGPSYARISTPVQVAVTPEEDLCLTLANTLVGVGAPALPPSGCGTLDGPASVRIGETWRGAYRPWASQDGKGSVESKESKGSVESKRPSAGPRQLRPLECMYQPTLTVEFFNPDGFPVGEAILGPDGALDPAVEFTCPGPGARVRVIRLDGQGRSSSVERVVTVLPRTQGDGAAMDKILSAID